MAKFSTDADLLKWEPTLMADLAVPGQRLSGGSDGVSNGLSFTSATGTFLDAGVEAGHVVRLATSDGEDYGCWQIISVESQTALLATQVGRADNPVDMVSGTAWRFSIDTFDPQAEEVRFELLTRLGLAVDVDGADLEEAVLERRSLRRASVFGCLAMIFEGASGTSPEGRNLAAKAALYRGLYDKELSKLRVKLDRDGDGFVDDMRAPGSIRMQRG
ncbi:MAG: hypothetical protein JXL80_09960 [Planctomycetes bacterium]|nr:hypothetical protein [Planctomycetota bacterium]